MNLIKRKFVFYYSYNSTLQQMGFLMYTLNTNREKGTRTIDPSLRKTERGLEAFFFSFWWWGGVCKECLKLTLVRVEEASQ